MVEAAAAPSTTGRLRWDPCAAPALHPEVASGRKAGHIGGAPSPSLHIIARGPARRSVEEEGGAHRLGEGTATAPLRLAAAPLPSKSPAPDAGPQTRRRCHFDGGDRGDERDEEPGGDWKS